MIIEKIADGTFGRCFQVSKGSYNYYAAKVVKSVKKYITAAKEEVNLLKFINLKDEHKSFAPTYYESFDWEGYYVIITSFHGKSLYELLLKNPQGR